MSVWDILMKMWSEPLREFKNIEVVGCMQQNVAVALLQDMKANVTSKRMIHDEKVVKIKVKVKVYTRVLAA